MSITGHKSIQSLAIYQRVKEDEKYDDEHVPDVFTFWDQLMFKE